MGGVGGRVGGCVGGLAGFCSASVCIAFATKLSRRRVALPHTDATAAKYGYLAMWAHSSLFSRLGAASTTAGWCINAGTPPRPLTRFRY